MSSLRGELSVAATALPFIDGEVIRQLVPVTDAIEASRRGFLAAVRGEILAPIRSSLCRGQVLVMPAEHSSGSSVIKVITTSSSGAQGRPSGIDGTVLWIDGGVGTLGALLDVTALTGLRTGAASGLATSLLAEDDATVLAMIGSGAQSMDQVAAVCAVRPIAEIRIYSRNFENTVRLRDRVIAAIPGAACRAVDSVVDAVRGADVVCTATRSTEPLFGSEELGSTTHVNAIGAFRPEMCELPSGAFRRASRVVVDEIGAALAEAGDVIRALEEGAVNQADIVEIGTLLDAPGRGRGRGGLTIFKSVGIAAQDWAIAELAVQRARGSGILPGL